MDENTLDSKRNTRILLSRNTPVALVVGAASFFGSHLTDKLLEKNLQVIGVGDGGKKENLKKAIGNKDFHLIISSAESFEPELERLDYIFIASEKEIDLEKILLLFKGFKPRLLFISSVELYDEENTPHKLAWLKKAEAEIARIARDNNLNARILRLGPVFGPGMNFNPPSGASEPIFRLIHQSLLDDLQKEASLEFSSRALYVDDATTLAIKCIFAGATAQKIFDGVLPTPIKVSEIKQVLLDPVWYEERDYKFTELPPWPTPNLLKTIKFLNWHPRVKIIEGLRETLSYFKDNEIKVEDLEEKKEDEEWKKEKIEELDGLKEEHTSKDKEKKEAKKGIKLPKFKTFYSKFLLTIGLSFIVYALIWPATQLGWGVLTFRFQLSEAVKNLEKGEFEKSLSNIKQASYGVIQAKAIYNSLEPLRQTGILKPQFIKADNLANLATFSSDASENTILGIQALYQSLRAVTGELSESPKDYFSLSQSYLALADENLSKAYAMLKDKDFKDGLPNFLKTRVESLSDKLSLYSNLINKARALSYLLPDIVALDSNKNYLVLLQNNNELRPGGGFIGSFAKISFEGGKLKKFEVNDIYAIDGQLSLHVEPPKEILKDLGQKDYYLRDSNFEPDFPTSARQASWFYTKETGERVEGVVALDISAMEDLLSVLGPLDLPDYREIITSDNLFEKSITYAESNFFPGTQAKRSFLTGLTQSLFNKLFFLPNQNWPQVVSSLGRSIDRKHLSVYLDDPKLFSYLVSQKWAQVLPRASSEEGKTLDFLAPVEANLGANKANYYLDRSYNLETTIGRDGEVHQRLRITYINRSPADVFPAGKYKNRMRVYLPFGTKLEKLLWGEVSRTADVTSSSDYGRLTLSFLLELLPKEQKTLVLDYQLPSKLKFSEGKAIYKLDVVKQAGTLKDPFVWTINYPINYLLISPKAERLGPQEQTIQTDLSVDRSFEVVFSK